MHVMEAIYDEHRKNPKLKLDEKTYDTIVWVLENRKNSKDN